MPAYQRCYFAMFVENSTNSACVPMLQTHWFISFISLIYIKPVDQPALLHNLCFVFSCGTCEIYTVISYQLEIVRKDLDSSDLDGFDVRLLRWELE